MQFLAGSMNKVFFVILAFFSLINFTNSYFCDWYNEYDILCASWNTIESIDNLDYFNSSYQSNIWGYFGNKFIGTFSEELEAEYLGYIWNKYNYTISPELWSTLGFLWTNRSYITPTYFYAPLWFMSLYDSQNLVADNQVLENDFSDYPLVTYTGEDNISSWSININPLSTCNPPKNITNANIEIKNNWLLDYIHLSWDNPGKEKVKIIRISPENKEFFVEDWVNYLDDYDTRIWNYSYFIAVYNDCIRSWLYSDLLRINYEWKDNLTALYLSILKNELTLHIPETIKLSSSTKIKLECKDSLGTFINSFLINNKYTFDTTTLKKYFTCEASFFDINWKFQKSELFVNNPIKDLYIREKLALDYIYKWDSVNQIYDLLYLNTPKFESWAYLSYWKSALYLVNILAKTYIYDENLSFDAFKNLGYIWANISVNDKIKEEDFINLLLFIEKDLVKYQKNIYDFINNNYWNKKYSLVLNDITKNINLIKRLKQFEISDKQKYNDLLACIYMQDCKDFSILNGLDQSGKQEISVNTYKDYMKLLYFNMWYETYKQKSYSLDDYNKFVDIIIESVSYWNTFYDNKISYGSFRNLQFEILLHLNLQKNISYLVEKHLEKILAIYKTSSKEDMIWLLRDFLGRE